MSSAQGTRDRTQLGHRFYSRGNITSSLVTRMEGPENVQGSKRDVQNTDKLSNVV